jgi:hypothetical protein
MFHYRRGGTAVCALQRASVTTGVDGCNAKWLQGIELSPEMASPI